MEATIINIYVNGYFLTRPLTGVQRFAYQILGAMDEMILSGEIDPNRYRWTCLIPPDTSALPRWKGISVHKVGRMTGDLWEQLELPFYARKGLLLNLANVGPFLAHHQATTIHDVSVFAVPQAYTFLFRMKHLANALLVGRTSALVFTVSQFSKSELVRHGRVPPRKIRVVSEGHEHILAIPSDRTIFERLQIGQFPYFLTVGSHSPHKNQSAVIQAVEILGSPGFEVISVGGTYSTVFQSDQLDPPTWLRQLGYVNDGELRALYEGAVGLIFPSLYEGFGLPPLEAMACGCPVIASRTASLPEVCGDAVLYCDPLNPGDIACQIQRLISDPSLRADLVQRGKQRASHFSWFNATRLYWNELLNVIEN